MPPVVLTGEHYMTGDEAIAEGAIAAGCRFFGGYPITPATEVAERMAHRLPGVGGVFIQMEDEIAAMASIIGASCAGVKAMTSTSGPGFSLMMENLGLAAITETPCVVVNVQRAGPSTGLPTQGAQGDMMQARWGSHGDYSLIALAPSTAQEAFHETIRAFNLAEKYRVPVLVMTDEVVGHMSERVVIPEASKLNVIERVKARGRKDRYRPFEPGENGVPPMAAAGEGYCVHVTGLTHDERGYPVMTAECQESMQTRLFAKIERNLDDIALTRGFFLDDAEIVLVSYGVSVRTCRAAMEEARALGYKVGLLQLLTVWPFPEEAVRALAGRVKAFITVEINLGQISLEVERLAAGLAPCFLAGHCGGTLISPDAVVEAVKRALKPGGKQ